MTRTTDPQQRKIFYKLSSVLTGFDEVDLLGTGVGEEYLAELVEGAGYRHVSDLLAAAKKAANTISVVRDSIWDDRKFGPMARNIVLMWYLGSWYPLPKQWHERYRPKAAIVPQHVVSARAYKGGLVWPAMGTHARGARPPGFGSWSERPHVGSLPRGDASKE